MDKKEQKSLVKELMERLKESKNTPETELKGRKLYKSVFQTGKYITKEEEHQLVTLKNFIVAHPELSNEEIVEIFKAKKSQFGFLIEFESRFSDFMNEVRYSYGQLVHRIVQNRRLDEIQNKNQQK